MWGGISEWYRTVYLPSEHWRQYRKDKLEWDQYRCADCGDRATEVHHRPADYSELYGESVEHSCVSLCRFCHEWRHTHGEPKSDPHGADDDWHDERVAAEEDQGMPVLTVVSTGKPLPTTSAVDQEWDPQPDAGPCPGGGSGRGGGEEEGLHQQGIQERLEHRSQLPRRLEQLAERAC